MAYVRTVKTGSGATAVQIVHGSRRGARTIEHVGSAHDELELEALKAAARQRLAGGQAQLDLGPGRCCDSRRGGGVVTIGLLTDAAGFPLMVEAFEGNAAETTTMLPTIRAFMAAHQLADVTIVADAGMVSEANRRAIEAAGLSFILGAKIPDIPYVVDRVAPRSTPTRSRPTG